jgi:hypothetical protein
LLKDKINPQMSDQVSGESYDERLTWLRLLTIFSKHCHIDQLRGPPGETGVALKRMKLLFEAGIPVGMSLKRVELGAKVGSITPNSWAVSLGLQTGDFLLDINGVFVLCEPTYSICSQLASLSRPLALRFLRHEVVYDCILWEKALGFSLISAIDFAQATEIINSSAASKSGVCNGDIVWSILNVPVESASFANVAHCDFSKQSGMAEFLGARLVLVSLHCCVSVSIISRLPPVLLFFFSG